MVDRPQYPPEFGLPAKIVLLVLSILPLCIFLGLAVFIAGLWLRGTPSIRLDTEGFFLFLTAIVTFPLLAFSLSLWYIVFLTRNPQVDSTAKIVWAIVLFQFNALALPIFWCTCISGRP
jgi:hypothetical protein